MVYPKPYSLTIDYLYREIVRPNYDTIKSTTLSIHSSDTCDISALDPHSTGAIALGLFYLEPYISTCSITAIPATSSLLRSTFEKQCFR